MLARALTRSLGTARLSPAITAPAATAFLTSYHLHQRQLQFRNYAKQSGRNPPNPSGSTPEPIPTPAESEPILPTEANAEPITAAESEPTPNLEAEAVPKARTSSSGGKGADGLPKSAYVSSIERRRQRMYRWFWAASLLGLVGFTAYMGRPLDEIEKKIHPEISDDIGSFFRRLNARRKDILDFYNEPPFDKLLPDVIPEYGRPYTLVISLEDLMVHSSWSREHGWRIAKRPGLDYFLAYLFQYYEIVVFTNQPDTMAAPIIQKVDQSPGYIMYPLFRAHTRYVDGKYVKDLRYLNRPLEKVIMLETNPDAWSANPDNTIKMKPWNGDANNNELVALIPFLEYIAALGIDDVRRVIKDYDGTHIPTEFARREELLREELRKSLPNKKRKQPPGFVLALLGMNPRPEDEGDGVKTFMDHAREIGTRNYIETQKHYAENKEEMEREQKKLEKEMQEQMKTSLSKIFSEGLPKQPGQ